MMMIMVRLKAVLLKPRHCLSLVVRVFRFLKDLKCPIKVKSSESILV